MQAEEKLAEMLEKSDNIVFFGGAGVSTESHIPDFRSTDGLYNQKYAYPPEMILSGDFFREKTDEFYRFYRDKMLFPDAKPNFAHRFLAKLEELGKLRGIVTQNIDGLHQKAGSKKVYELHGSVYRNHCTRCHKFYGLSEVLGSEGIPRCSCGGVIKPDVVLYGEGLDEDCILKSVSLIRNADVLIVGGTSLNVYPAAGFLNYYRGNKLCVINRDPISLSSQADLNIEGKIGETFRKTAQYMHLDIEE